MQVPHSCDSIKSATLGLIHLNANKTVNVCRVELCDLGFLNLITTNEINSDYRFIVKLKPS